MLIKVDVNLQTPEAFYVQQRKNATKTNGMNMGNILLPQETKTEMDKYARAKSSRYNLDLRAEQLKFMSDMPELPDRPTRTTEEVQAAKIQSDAQKKDSDVKLYLDNLKDAVDRGDQIEINRAIITEFLQELAPERLPEVDDLLEEYQGKETELFDKLRQEHPVIAGENLEGENLQEFNKFKSAFDQTLEEKKKAGEFVLSIVENGGNWWVNRQKPTVHPSRRKRETFLPELRSRGKKSLPDLNLNL
eukprot:CAMPEP_0204834616 /NCGR_PEP_ID=MMETSP1346-20131115/20192_1 /ASSEMBLY_ACC=CAM_ASM_000771 /TAXON_ID=215587 /ORGANISM="Aplanochytrium stocchinoi, Strain GSBS06" /LENGTH=246 /DNA_ID=CAMNT_0051968011 /DNA_START=62 /DNA_END=802 /DNA_ORIENTATION=+